MKLGVGSYTFTWAVGVPGKLPPPGARMGANELLAEARRLGVAVVQICDNLPFFDLLPAEVDAVLARAAEWGIDLEWGTRGIDPDLLRRNLELCRRTGCRALRLVIDRGDDEPSPDEAVRRLGEVMPDFEAAGVALAIENHDRFPAATLARMVENLGPHRAGITLDTVNSFGALEPPEVVVAALARYTRCLHIKDFTVRRPGHQMGFLVEGCAAGSGRLDVPWLLREVGAAAAGHGHPCNAILETWVTPGEDLEETLARERLWAEEGVAFLRDHIAG